MPRAVAMGKPKNKRPRGCSTKPFGITFPVSSTKVPKVLFWCNKNFTGSVAFGKPVGEKFRGLGMKG